MTSRESQSLRHSTSSDSFRSSGSSAAIQIAVRIRPPNSRELGSVAFSSTVCRSNDQSDNQIVLDPPTHRIVRKAAFIDHSELQTFTYDHVFDDTQIIKQTINQTSNSSPTHSNNPIVSQAAAVCQQRVYDAIGQPIVDNALLGYNCSLLAYGQTSSGKTHSMFGSTEDVSLSGLIPRICQAIFDACKNTNTLTETYNDWEHVVRSVECSYYEIYAEKVRDLLDPRKKNLRIREHPINGAYIEDLSLLACTDVDSCMNLIKTGNLERTVAATNMNSESSRSHAVFSLIVTTTTIDDSTKLQTSKVSKVQLVDLAGSERVDHTGATGMRLKEAATINKSLTTLGRVVQALAQRSELQNDTRQSVSKSRNSTMKRDDGFVPFRDSILTWLLKESLGGNSKTVMLACVSPVEFNYEETLSTLRYASRAKNIVNRAVINEDPNAELIRQLREEVQALKWKLSVVNNTPVHSGGAPELSLQARQAEAREKELAAMAKSIEALKTELTNSSSSMATMTIEWQQKLKKAQDLERLRRKAIEARGIALVVDRQLPFIINLNEDPMLNETVAYHLVPGATIIGSRPKVPTSLQLPPDEEESIRRIDDISIQRLDEEILEIDSDAELDVVAPASVNRIVITGINVREDHCRLVNTNDSVIIEAVTIAGNVSNATTHVNGEPLIEPRELAHGDRVVIGMQHFFRFCTARHQRDPTPSRPGTTFNTLSPNSTLSLSSISNGSPNFRTFEFAQHELYNPGKPMQDSRYRERAADERSLISHALREEDEQPDSHDPVRMNLMNSFNLREPASAPPTISPPLTPVDEMVWPDNSPNQFRVSLTSDPAEPALPTFHEQPPSAENSPQRPVVASGGWTSETSSSVPSPRLPSTINYSQFSYNTDEPTVIITDETMATPVKSRVRPQTAPDASPESLLEVMRISSPKKPGWSDTAELPARKPMSHQDLEQTVAKERAALTKQQQQIVHRHERRTARLMQPTQTLTAQQFRAVSNAIFKWRWLRVKLSLSEEITKLVFLCDEANAINAALQRPERYKVELSSFHNILPEVFLSVNPLLHSAGQSSPLQRLRQLKIVFVQVVEVRRRQLPAPLLSFDYDTFADQVAALRQLYEDQLQRGGESQSSHWDLEAWSALQAAGPTRPTLRLGSMSNRSSVSSLLSSPSVVLPSADLYDHPQMMGRALAYLAPLKYGLTVQHSIPVLDDRGDYCGHLNVVLELCSVHREQAKRDIEQDDRMRLKQEHDEEIRRQQLNDPDSESDEELSQLDQLADDADMSDPDSSRVTALTVRAHSMQFVERGLTRLGLRSFWLKYHVKEQTFAYRSRRVLLNAVDDKYQMDYTRTHYFTGMDLQQLGDYIAHDAMIFEIWCKVDDPSNNNTRLFSHSKSNSIIGMETSSAQRGSVSQQPTHRPASQSMTLPPPNNRSVSDNLSPSKPSHRSSASELSRTASFSGRRGSSMKPDTDALFIENGKTRIDYLLFLSCDWEEESAARTAGKRGDFVPCFIKADTSISALFRISANHSRRVVLTIMQADHRPFVIESIMSIQAVAVSVTRQGHEKLDVFHKSEALRYTFPILEQIANVDAKLLVCSASWPHALEDHPLMQTLSDAGERVTLVFNVECNLRASTTPIRVTMKQSCKVYAAAKPSLFSKTKALIDDSERIVKLGVHCAVTRRPSAQTLDNVYREHELVLEQIQRRLRSAQQEQIISLANELNHTDESMARSFADAHAQSADELIKRFPLRFGRLLADVRTRSGIEMSTDVLAPHQGVRSGYLTVLKQEKGRTLSEPRWFVLRPPFLFCFTNREDRNEEFNVRLFQAEFALAGGHSFSIKPASASKTLVLQAADALDMQSWLRAMNVHGLDTRKMVRRDSRIE